jgi:hypothetical protein
MHPYTTDTLCSMKETGRSYSTPSAITIMADEVQDDSLHVSGSDSQRVAENILEHAFDNLNLLDDVIAGSVDALAQGVPRSESQENMVEVRMFFCIREST